MNGWLSLFGLLLKGGWDVSGGGDGGNTGETPEAGHFSGLKAVKVSYLPADFHENILFHLLWSWR